MNDNLQLELSPGTATEKKKKPQLFSKVAAPFQRLTAQSLKFRVTLSSLGCEEVPSSLPASASGPRSTAYLSWIRGSKKINTPQAEVQEGGKVEWQEEMTQVVTMYFQVEKGNLIPTRKDYSVKIKDGRTKKTLGKLKLDISKYCGLESFKRTFLELETKHTSIKLFMVITTELVDEGHEQSQDEMSPSVTRRTLSDTHVSAQLSGGDFEVDQTRDFSKSMHDISSPSPLSPDEDSRDLIQQSIDILHSSSSEEDEEERKEEGFFQAIARRMTPKATPSTASTHKTRVVNRRHTIATADTQPIAKTLVFQGIDEEEEENPNMYQTPMRDHNHNHLLREPPLPLAVVSNPFGEVPDMDIEDEEKDIEEQSISTTPPSVLSDQQQDLILHQREGWEREENEVAISQRKLKQEVALLKTQCSQLQVENTLLKDKLQAQEDKKEDEERSLDRLKREYDQLAADHALLKKQMQSKTKANAKGKGKGKGKGKDTSAVSQVPASPSTDMLEELIETKMKLAQAQSALDELNRSTSISDNPSNKSM